MNDDSRTAYCLKMFNVFVSKMQNFTHSHVRFLLFNIRLKAVRCSPVNNRNNYPETVQMFVQMKFETNNFMQSISSVYKTL